MTRRRFRPRNGFCNGADYALFEDGKCCGLVWADGRRLDWWPWTLGDAEAHVRDNLWVELNECESTSQDQ